MSRPLQKNENEMDCRNHPQNAIFPGSIKYFCDPNSLSIRQNSRIRKSRPAGDLRGEKSHPRDERRKTHRAGESRSAGEESGLMNQPVPKVTSKHVERIVNRDFPAEQVAEVMVFLDEYGKEKFEVDVDRVRLAVLKLANGNLEMVRKRIQDAKGDYRDVLSWAEYPTYSKNICSYKLPEDQKQQIYSDDWQQYLTWANKK